MTNIDKPPHLRKCEYCKGKDGKKKDIYETFQSAFDTAKYIEEDRKTYLDVYPCPYGNGWHLTKNNASSEIIERKETLFQNNDIPLKSSNGSWEYLKNAHGELEEEKYTRANVTRKKKAIKDMPIKKMECQPNVIIKELSGRIMEFVKNVNIEKIFKINLQNVFCANLVKNILDGTVNQITIYAENKNQFESYTVLIMDRLLQGAKIARGKEITLKITGKTINGINAWCCDKVIR
jgi:hypothetical protein